MATIEELQQSLQSQGIDTEEPSPTDKKVTDNNIEQPKKQNVIDQILAPVKAVGNDPVGATLSAARGVEESFVPSPILHRIEGTMLFPIIRGAEISAKIFNGESNNAEFTTYRKLVDDSMLLDESLKQRGQGIKEGIETGIAIESGRQLLKMGYQGLKSVAPKFIQGVREWNAARLTNKATNLGRKLLQLNKGPVLDAVLDRPEEVMKLLKTDSAYIDDLAKEFGDKLTTIEDGLGAAVGKHRKSFVADPTKRVNVIDPVQLPDGNVAPSPRDLLEQFKKSTTTDDGISVLSSKQKSNLDFLDKTLNKQDIVKEIPRDAGSIKVVEPFKDISGRDALLLLDKIDEMTSIKEITNGNISANNVRLLLDIRKSLKNQIRGSNVEWAKADQLFSNYKEDALNIADKLTKDSRESFVDSLFNKNKTPIRDRIQRTLDYADYVDTNLKGSGDAFFRRLANIKGAHSIQEVTGQLSDKTADNVNNIVKYWIKTGGNVGESVGLGLGGSAGSLVFDTGGALITAGFSSKAGKAIGQAAGLQVGLRMANPQRVLDAAIKAKDVTLQTKRLASDLQYIHQNFGNAGVISMMDILGSTPAVNELIKFSNSIVSSRQKGEKNAISNNATNNP